MYTQVSTPIAFASRSDTGARDAAEGRVQCILPLGSGRMEKRRQNTIVKTRCVLASLLRASVQYRSLTSQEAWRGSSQPLCAGRMGGWAGPQQHSESWSPDGPGFAESKSCSPDGSGFAETHLGPLFSTTAPCQARSAHPAPSAADM